MGSSYDEYMDDYEASRTVADIDDQRLKQLRNYASWERENGPAGKLHILDWAAEEITRLRAQLAEVKGLSKEQVEQYCSDWLGRYLTGFFDTFDCEDLRVAYIAGYELGSTTHPAPAKVPDKKSCWTGYSGIPDTLPINSADAWAEGWNACREAMLKSQGGE